MLVSGAAAGAASVLIGGCDQMASWFIARASSGSGFADHLANLLGLATVGTSHAAGAPAGFTVGLAGTVTTAFIAIVLGIIAFLATVIQIMLMLVRGGMLVLLVGTLPLVAAFSNTEMGLQWFRKASAWLLAFALYKPAAAVVYAVAFDLAGQPGALALLDGVMMLVLAILALPALLRFVVPATSALDGRRRRRERCSPARPAARSRCGCRPAPRRSQRPPRAHTDKGRAAADLRVRRSRAAARPARQAGTAAGASGQAGRNGRDGGPGSNGSAGAAGAAGSPSGDGRVRGRTPRARARARVGPVRPVWRALRFRRTGPASRRPRGRWSRATRAMAATGRPARPGSPAKEEGASVAAEAQVERTYGNWRRPRPPGLWHLGLISSVLLIVGLIAAIIVIALVGLVPGLVLLALMGPVFLVTLRPDPHGQTPMQRLGMRLGWHRARADRLASVSLGAARSHAVRDVPAARAAGLKPAV